jgi:hypothetical protein
MVSRRAESDLISAATDTEARCRPANEDRALSRFGRLDYVSREDRATSGSIFIGAVGCFARLHATPCVVEGIFQDAHDLGVERPVSISFDKAPHGLTRAYQMGGSDQPSLLLPSLLRPAMVVTLHSCSLRDYDIRGPILCTTRHASSAVASTRLRALIIVHCGNLTQAPVFTPH